LGILDSTAEEPRSKALRWVVGGLIFALLMSAGIWWLFRFQAEKNHVSEFMDAVVAGEFERAHQIWNPSPAYTFSDFLEDWGEDGYYGPVRSYRIATAQRLDDASGVTVVVSISPFAPYPHHTEKQKHEQSQEVFLWVERSNQTIGFAPAITRRRSR
jgi:hypothetical protein